jgi:(p)ppGpp synthase/HD superfamily hydrolase
MTVAVSKNMDENKNQNVLDGSENGTENNENKQPTESPEELLKKVSAIRKELDRLEKKKQEEERGVYEQIRQKNVEKAFAKASEQFKDLADKQKLDAVKEYFNKIDSKQFDVEDIINDIKKAYAVVNADELLNKAKEVEKKESATQEKMAELGSHEPSSGATGEQKQFSADAQELAQKLGTKPEEAEKYLSETKFGEGWSY